MVDNANTDLKSQVTPLNTSSSDALHMLYMGEAIQVWYNLEFQVKLVILLTIWFIGNLLLIRIAWWMYGHRLSEILVKEFMTKDSTDGRLPSEDPLHNKFPPTTEKMHRD